MGMMAAMKNAELLHSDVSRTVTPIRFRHSPVSSYKQPHVCLYKLLARDAHAKLALIVAQIYPSVHPSVHLCVCPRQLESMGALYSSKFCSEAIIGFFS